MEQFVNAAQTRLMRHMPKVWDGDDECYACPILRCDNKRRFLEQRPKLDYNEVCRYNVGDEGGGEW